MCVRVCMQKRRAFLILRNVKCLEKFVDLSTMPEIWRFAVFKFIFIYLGYEIQTPPTASLKKNLPEKTEKRIRNEEKSIDYEDADLSKIRHQILNISIFFFHLCLSIDGRR